MNKDELKQKLIDYAEGAVSNIRSRLRTCQSLKRRAKLEARILYWYEAISEVEKASDNDLDTVAKTLAAL